MFLAISTLLELVCIYLYAYVFPNLPVVKYYRTKAALEGSKTVSSDLVAAGIQTNTSVSVRVSNNLCYFNYSAPAILSIDIRIRVWPS